MSFQTAVKYAFKHKEPIEDLHAPPVINTWYTPIDVKGGGQVNRLRITQSNTEAAAKNVEWELTLDGIVYTGTKNINSGDYEHLFIDNTTFDWMDNLQGEIRAQIFITGGITSMSIGACSYHQFKFRYRLTSAAGTAQTLDAVINYESLDAV